MSFLSYDFALFFLAVAALCLLSPRKIRPGILLAASLVFYGLIRLSFLALLIAEALAAYASGLWLSRKERPARRFVFIVSLGVLLSPLFVFKYSGSVLSH
jgi:D-alanyl-lipoteichoic acid acyltransferase DltB (MBOAT superfamily)